MVPFLDCREIVYLSFSDRQGRIAPIRSHSGRIFSSLVIRWTTKCSICWNSRGTCTDTCVREGRSEAQRPTSTSTSCFCPIPCHLSLRQGKGKRAFFLSNQFSSWNNQSTITNTIRFGLGNATRSLPHSHRDLNELARLALIFPRVGDGWRARSQDIGYFSFSPSEKSDEFTTSLAWLRHTARVNQTGMGA